MNLTLQYHDDAFLRKTLCRMHLRRDVLNIGVVEDSSFILDGVIIAAMLVVVLTPIREILTFFNLKL